MAAFDSFYCDYILYKLHKLNHEADGFVDSIN